MAHSHHLHREHQVSHRRVHNILKDEPAGAKKHFDGGAFSKVTSKSAAEGHDTKVAGNRAPKRFARGGKVKGSTTNIAIVVPNGGNRGAAPSPGMPPGGPAIPAMAGPPPGPPPGMPPGGPPPGMPPMRASGGRINNTLPTDNSKASLKKWSDRASANSYFRGGAATGVGREEKANRMKRGK
jgi:hypothetical protein